MSALTLATLTAEQLEILHDTFGYVLVILDDIEMDVDPLFPYWTPGNRDSALSAAYELIEGSHDAARDELRRRERAE